MKPPPYWRVCRDWSTVAMRCFRWLSLSAGAMLLTACASDVHMSFLDPQGPVATAERWHFFVVLGILVVLVAAPIFLAMPFVLWRYRYGNKAARYTPKWHFSRFLEFVTWGGPVIIVCGLGFFVWRDAHRLDPYQPLEPNAVALQVQVIGYNWKWLIVYPDQGIATIGIMAMPAGRPVAMHLTSATVMQSFFIPSLGSQMYAMGGMVTQLHLKADHPGRFLAENTMYNGKGFHKQKFNAVAMPPAQFKAWVRHVRAVGAPLNNQILRAIAERDTLEQLIDELPPGAVHDGAVYLTDVTPKLFLAVVRATMLGTEVKLTQTHPPAPVPAITPPESQKPPADNAP